MKSRNSIVEIIEKNFLNDVCRHYRLRCEDLKLISEYEGFQNIIYMTPESSKEYIRITFRKDRTYEDVMAEVSFINHLHENGVSVSTPIISNNQNYVEKFKVGTDDFYVVVFNKAKGKRLADNGYRYREGVSIDEYFTNYGKVLGKMHKLAKTYKPTEGNRKRHDWLMNMQNLVLKVAPEEQNELKIKINRILNDAAKLDREPDAFGLIHADFGDGNFTIDYDTGEITVFDFDDSAYCWFMYDLADAWTKSVGWCQFESSAQNRKEYMNDYFNKIMSGYLSENSIDSMWLEKLPFFIKLVEVEGLLSEFEYMLRTDGEIEYDEEINYSMKCLLEDIPYRGFFSEIYSEKAPFCIV